MGDFTEETYSGTAAKRFTEGSDSDEADVLTLVLEDGTELHFTFLEVTKLSGAEDVSEGDIVEITSGPYEFSSAFHPIFSIEVK